MRLEDKPQVQAFLARVCSEIKRKKIHTEVKLELLSHLEEAVEVNMEDLEEDAAVTKAVQQMGDAAAVGRQLNKVHRQWPDWRLLAETLVLALVGVAMMYFICAKGPEGPSTYTYGTDLNLFTKSVFNAIMGIVLLTGFTFFDYRKFKPFSKHIYGAAVGLWWLPLYMRTSVNSVKWLIVGFLHFSYASVGCVLFIVALAGILEEWNWNGWKNSLYAFVLLGSPVVFFAGANSYGMIPVYLAAAIVLMLLSGAKWRDYAIGAAATLLLTLFVAFSQWPYTVEKILAFMNPQQDPTGAGWHYIQVREAISSAGPLGQGFTLDPQRIPLVYSEFSFVYITYTFGWVASGAIILLIAVFIRRMLRVLHGVRDRYGKRIIAGFIAMLSMRFVWNILMVLGLLPISSMSLPFVSHSGSQLLLDMAVVGLMSGIYRRKNEPETLGKVGNI